MAWTFGFIYWGVGGCKVFMLAVCSTYGRYMLYVRFQKAMNKPNATSSVDRTNEILWISVP